jgi:hypothetical protein
MMVNYTRCKTNVMIALVKISIKKLNYWKYILQRNQWHEHMIKPQDNNFLYFCSMVIWDVIFHNNVNYKIKKFKEFHNETCQMSQICS